jgi:hypothetical protein
MGFQPRAAAVAVLLALLGGSLIPLAAQEPTPPASAMPRTEPAVIAPDRLDIPRIGLHTRLLRLGRGPDGAVRLPAPGRGSPPGWYDDSATPGDAGTAVLIGHVDPARDGPAVFHRLGALRPGDTVSVHRSDGVTVRFRVTGLRLHRSAPEVHPATRSPSLRLVTTGGNFDPDRRRHRSNLVVLAETG